MVDSLLQECRFAARALRRSPAFTTVAVLTFAVGIGMNIAVFSVIDRLLFRPLPYDTPDRLVVLRECPTDGPCLGTVRSAIAYEARALSSFDEIAIAGPTRAYRSTPTPGDADPVWLVTASPALLRTLGVAPALGRFVDAGDVASKRLVAVLSHETWQRRFGGSAGVLGTELWAGRAAPATVIGVLPAGFIPPAVNGHDPRWDGVLFGNEEWVSIGPSERSFPPIARLKAGVSIEEARAQLAGLLRRLDPVLRDPGRPATPVQLDPLQTTIFSSFRSNFWLLVGTTALLLVLACANLATLLLALGRSRERDAAVVAALGASRLRTTSQALATAALICLAGCAAALLAVLAASRALTAILPPLIARYATDATDPRVLGMALAAAAISTLAAGVLPAFSGSRVDVLSVLQRTPASSRAPRLRGGAVLLTFETAIGVVLVLGAAVMLRTFVNLADDDLGYRPDGLYFVFVGTERGSPEAALTAYEQALGALASVPGIVAVGGSDSPVGGGAAPMRGVTVGGTRLGGRFEITDGYFETLRTPMLAGRAFTDIEVRRRAPVAILSRAAARALWPGTPDAEIVGRLVTPDGEPPLSVVGIVPDFKARYGQEAIEPAMFVPLGSQPRLYSGALVRVADAAGVETAAMQLRIRERLGQATVSVTPVMDRLEPGLRDPEFRATLFSILALGGLLLAATGLYAVAAFDVRQRLYEVGVRLSVGATAADIRRMVILRTCAPVASGVAVGFVAAYWSGQLLQQFVYQVDPREPLLYAVAGVTLLATGLAASWFPAWRAGRLEPSVVLRAQ